MKLSQALKTKNRLAGEIAQQQVILQRENARRDDTASKVDRGAVYAKVLKLSEELGTLKAKIASANVGIYAKLERMAEKKAHIAFLQSLPKKEGQEVQHYGRNDEKLTYTWDSFIGQEACDQKVAEIQTEIGKLQDEVDAFNATTDL